MTACPSLHRCNEYTVFAANEYQQDWSAAARDGDTSYDGDGLRWHVAGIAERSQNNVAVWPHREKRHAAVLQRHSQPRFWRQLQRSESTVYTHR